MSPPRFPVLPAYVARRVLGPFVGLTGVLLFVLALEKMMSLVQVVTELKAPVYKVGGLITYLLPYYLGMAIPAAWFLAVLIAVRNLQRDSELTIMRATGVPLRKLLVPLLAVSLALASGMVVLMGYLQPVTRYAYRVELQELKRKDFWSKIEPGAFTSLGDDRSVLRVGEVAEEGRLLRDFFASYRSSDTRRVLLSAREAAVNIPEAGSADSDTQLELRDCSMLVIDDLEGAAPRLVSLTFGVFPWSLSEGGLLPAYGPRGNDEREMTSRELLANDSPAKNVEVAASRRLTEWHTRIVRSVSAIILTVLAVPLGLLGSGRTSRPYGFFIGVVLVVLYQKVLGAGESYGKLAEVPPDLAVWTPFAGLTLLAVSLFHWLGGDRNGPAPRAHKASPAPPRTAAGGNG